MSESESECDNKSDCTKSHDSTFVPSVSPRRVFLVGGYRRLCPRLINRTTVIDSVTVISVSIYRWCVSLFPNQSKGIFPLFILIMSYKIRKQLQEITLENWWRCGRSSFRSLWRSRKRKPICLNRKASEPEETKYRALMSALSKLWGMADVVSSRVFENNKIQFLF